MDESVRPHRQRRSCPLAVEALEARALLSVSIAADHLLAIPVGPPALVGWPAQGQPIVNEVEAGVRSGQTLASLNAAQRAADPDDRADDIKRYEHVVTELSRADVAGMLLPSPPSTPESVAGPRATAPPAAHPDVGPGDPAGPQASAAGVKGVEGHVGQAVTPRGEDAKVAPASDAGSTTTEGLPPAREPTQPPFSGEDPTAVALSAQVRALVEGGLPFDLSLLQRNVDDFFTRLSQIGEGGEDWQMGSRLGPWLIVLTAATLAAAHRWDKKHGRCACHGDEAVLGAATPLTEED